MKLVHHISLIYAPTLRNHSLLFQQSFKKDTVQASRRQHQRLGLGTFSKVWQQNSYHTSLIHVHDTEHHATSTRLRRVNRQGEFGDRLLYLQTKHQLTNRLSRSV